MHRNRHNLPENSINNLALSYLNKDNEKIIEVTDLTLTDRDMKLFNRVREIHSKFIQIKNMQRLVEVDYTAFKDFINSKKHSYGDDSKFYLDYYLVHILSSAKLFTNFVENVFNEISKSTNNHDFFDNYKKLLSSIYDASFAYRFCYHLRNYTQHRGNIVHQVTRQIDPNDNHTLEAKIIIDYLINSNYNWKKVIKEDLERRKSEIGINIESLITNFKNDLNYIYRHSMILFLKAYNAELKQLKDDLSNLYDTRKSPMLASVKKSDFEKLKKTKDVNFYSISLLDGAHTVDNIYIELSKIGIVKLEINHDKWSEIIRYLFQGAYIWKRKT